MIAALHKAVRKRARYRCEYCHFPEQFAELPFHFDHVISRQHGGQTELENLAFACCYCNRYKGPNLSRRDPTSGKVVSLFSPREDKWSDHFSWNGPLIVGKTPVGRATVQTLQFNRSDAVAVRHLLMRAGEYDAAQ